MNKLPKQIYIQIDDVDDGKVWYSCAEKKEDLEFTESDSHPVALYELKE